MGLRLHLSPHTLWITNLTLSRSHAPLVAEAIEWEYHSI